MSEQVISEEEVYTVLFTFKDEAEASAFVHWRETNEQGNWNRFMVDRENRVMFYNLSSLEFYKIRTILRNRKMPYQYERLS